MNYCGIDLASKSSAVCVVDGADEVLWAQEVPSDEDGFRTGLKGWKGLRIVLEASPLAEWAAQQLEQLGHEVVVIDPRRAKAVIQTKRKTDKLDARNLARMARTGWYTVVHRKSPEARLRRTELKARQGLVEVSNAMQARIRGLLRAHGIKLGSVSESEFEAHVLAVLEQRAPELKPLLRPLLDIWRRASHTAAKMYTRLKRTSVRDPVRQHLMTAPGVGPALASAYIATLDEPRRFANGEQVAAYVGLVPQVHQSGDTEYRGRITKEGDGLLRWLLVEAAHVLLTRTRRSFALKAWGLKLKEKKGHAKACVAVARKLAVILYRMWLSGERFDWQRA